MGLVSSSMIEGRIWVPYQLSATHGPKVLLGHPEVHLRGASLSEKCHRPEPSLGSSLSVGQTHSSWACPCLYPPPVC